MPSKLLWETRADLFDGPLGKELDGKRDSIMGSVIKKRRKKIARHKFRKRLKKQRWQRKRR